MTSQRFVEVCRALFRYSFRDVKFDAGGLTPEEAKCGEREELDLIMRFAETGEKPFADELRDESLEVAHLAATIAPRWAPGSKSFEEIAKLSVELARKIMEEARRS